MSIQHPSLHVFELMCYKWYCLRRFFSPLWPKPQLGQFERNFPEVPLERMTYQIWIFRYVTPAPYELEPFTPPPHSEAVNILCFSSFTHHHCGRIPVYACQEMGVQNLTVDWRASRRPDVALLSASPEYKGLSTGSSLISITPFHFSSTYPSSFLC
jgi:hypothetical protein